MNDTADIRGIRLPEPHPLRDFLSAHWPLGAGLVLGLLLLGLAWRWWRQRAVQPVPTLLQRTLAELDAARALLQSGDAQAFSLRVSQIVRGYVEQRFAVQALQRTTAEFLRAGLTEQGAPLAPYRAELSQFLQQCDLAKFAGWAPSSVEAEALLASARAFVQRSGRVPPPSGAATP